MSVPGRRFAALMLSTATLLSGTAARASWEPIGPESPPGLTSLAIDPTDPDVVFAGTGAAGVYRSGDGGATWAPARAGLERGVGGLALDAGAPASLYASGLWGSGVGRSVDSGASWQSVGDGLDFTRGIATVPGSPGTVYACGRAIFRSDDGGVTWTTVYERVAAGDRETLCDVQAAGEGTPIVYATSEDEGILRSMDGGASWERVGVEDVRSTCELHLLGVAASDPLVLYVAGQTGLLRSRDGGVTWSQRSALDGEPRAVAVDPLDPNTVYVATTTHPVRISRLARSRDGGTTFSIIDGPWDNASVDAIAVSPSDSRILYAGTGAGVFRSSDGGTSWSGGFAGMRGQSVGATAVDASRPERVAFASDPDGLYLSEDGGESFAQVADGRDGLSFTDVAFDPIRPRVVYAARSVNSAGGGGVARSVDGGRSFALASAGLPYDEFDPTRLADVARVLVDPRNGFAYAFTWVTGGVHRSTDGGQSWLPFDRGFESGDLFNAIALDPTTRTLYAARRRRSGTVNGLLARAPSDPRWRLLSTSLGAPAPPDEEAYAIAVAPTDPATIYVGTLSFGVFRSRDGGRTWTHASDGLPTATPVVALAVDPAFPARVYAETQSGVFRSDDAGSTWLDVSENLYPRRSGGLVDGTLALDPSGLGALYVGTQGGGMYRRRLPCAAAPLAGARLRLLRLDADAGNDGLFASATAELASQAPVDPGSIGVRLRAVDADGGVLADVNVPGGGAWRSSQSGRFWQRRAAVAGEGQWTITLHQHRDRLSLRLTARRLHLAAARSRLPAALEVGFATADGRTCARTSPGSMTCRREDGGRRVRCG